MAVTPVYCCGLECGAAGAGSHMANGGTAPAFSTTTVRTGARALRCNVTTGHSYVNLDSGTLAAWIASLH